MALMVRKKVASGSTFAEEMNQSASMRPVGEEDDGMDFGFDEIGPDHDDCEEDGPPYEPEPYESPLEPSVQKPVTGSSPIKKPLRKPAMPMKDATAVKSLTAEPIFVPSKSNCAIPASERAKLSCEMSRSHHRRLKIHSAMTGKSILAIIEGWIDQHCPRLPEP